MITATKAKELLMPIPNEDFVMMKFTDGKNKCCVSGHLRRLNSNDPNDFSIANCNDEDDATGIQNLAREYVRNNHKSYGGIVGVNNGGINSQGKMLYAETEIKDRVLHLLDDMIKAGY